MKPSEILGNEGQVVWPFLSHSSQPDSTTIYDHVIRVEQAPSNLVIGPMLRCREPDMRSAGWAININTRAGNLGIEARVAR